MGAKARATFETGAVPSQLMMGRMAQPAPSSTPSPTRRRVRASMSGDKFTPPPPAPPPPSDDAIIVSSPMLSELAEAQAQADEKASWKEAEEQEALQMMKEPIGSPA